MSDTNFVSYTDAQSVLGGFANAIKGKDDPYTTISYADWLELTDQEKETGKYYITGAPGADGSIQVDLMTKLWENPSPTAEFAAQNINVSIANYNFVMILARWTANENTVQAFLGKIGDSNIVINFGLASASGSRTMQRYATISNTVKITFSDAINTVGTTASTTNNARCIPISIYGIKTTQTIRLNAIASDVSTSADKCMLSDGVTSVEEAIKQETVTVTKESGETVATMLSRLYNLIDFSKISERSKLRQGINIYSVSSHAQNSVFFCKVLLYDGVQSIHEFVIAENEFKYLRTRIGSSEAFSYSDLSSSGAPDSLTIYY